MNEIMGHPWIFIGLASIFYKSSSIWFIIHFPFKNIINPWPCRIFLHIIDYYVPCVEKYSVDVNKIFLKRFTWAHLFTRMCSLLTLTRSQDNILGCKMDSQRNMGRIIGSTYLIAHNNEGNVCNNVKAMQVPQASSAFKSQTEIAFHVGGIQFAPSITINTCGPWLAFVQNGQLENKWARIQRWY